MVARPFRKVVAGGFLLFVLLAGRAACGAQDNAVGGAVWSQLDEKPLAGVIVVLIQNEKIKDTTGEKDGVYLLRVPRSMSTFDLSFRHPAYMPKTLRNLKNTEREHKVKPVKLASYQGASIRRLSVGEIEQLIADAREELSQATSGSDAALWEAGTTTLRLLVNAAGGFDEQARQEADAGNHDAAEALLKRALHIKSRILHAGDPALAGTALAYAELLDKLGRKAEAGVLRQRAVSTVLSRAGVAEKMVMASDRYKGSMVREGFNVNTPMPEDKRIRLGVSTVAVPVFLRGLDVENFWLTATSSGRVMAEVAGGTSDFDIRVVDQTGKVIAIGTDGAASWRTGAGDAYHVYLINRTSLSLFRPVRLLLEGPSAAPARRR